MARSYIATLNMDLPGLEKGKKYMIIPGDFRMVQVCEIPKHPDDPEEPIEYLANVRSDNFDNWKLYN